MAEERVHRRLAAILAADFADLLVAKARSAREVQLVHGSRGSQGKEYAYGYWNGEMVRCDEGIWFYRAERQFGVRILR